jgi:hypothetical protein
MIGWLHRTTSGRILALVAGGLVLAALTTSAVVGRPVASEDPPAAAAADAKAVDAPKAAVSRITNVTVYPNSALVTREVDVPAALGSYELVVTPLPQHTVTNSLYSEGADGVRVLTTRYRVRPVKEDTREEVRKFEEEGQKLRALSQKLQSELAATEQNLAFIGKLEGFTGVTTVTATEKGKLDSDASIAMSKYVMDGRTEKSKDIVGIKQQIQDNAEKLEFVGRKLRELTAGSSKTEQDAVIVVEKTAAGPAVVRLNYLVDAAAWRPLYKVRAGKLPKDPVQVEYLAAVVQQTGEDWAGVTVTFSTAQPMLNAAPPELKMLAVAVMPRTAVAKAGGAGQLGQFGGMQGGGQGLQGNTFLNNSIPNPNGLATAKDLNETARQLRRQAQQELNSRKEAPGNEILNYAAALEQAGDLCLADEIAVKGSSMLTARGPKNEGPSVSYHLGTKLSVPSRNDEQVLEVARVEMAPDYFYKAVPVMTPHVYREATLTNTSKYVILPGEATMYNGSDFVGRMNLPLVAVGEQFTVGFGAEPQLQVDRHMLVKSKSNQGGNQILRYEYRILASSYKPEKVRLQVWDRLPREENETMNVILVKTTPELSRDPLYLREDRPNNLLRWDLELEPAMNGEKALAIQYEFKLELDKQMTFGTFQSK